MSEYKDYIVRATAADHQLRAFAVTSKDIVEKAREIHNTSPVATAAIGRLLTAASMMGSMMKGEKDVLTLQIECGGPIGGITVTADSNADVKGYVNNPNVILPPNAQGKLDVSGALGPGFLNVIKDIGLREPYNGQTYLVSGEIAEDLTYYFATSEQVPSSVGLGVLMDKDNHVRQAGGFIIQVMPDTDDEVIDKLEARLGEVHSVTEMLDKGMTPEDILNYVLEGMDVEILETVPTQYKCDCSFERVSKVIASLGKKELQEMIDDGKPVEVNCQFCGSHYKFDTEQLKEFIK
jgi:molecular chaperone Hsp33